MKYEYELVQHLESANSQKVGRAWLENFVYIDSFVDK